MTKVERAPPEPTEAETLRRQLQYAADFWRGQLAAEMWHPTREHIEMVISAFDRAALCALPLQDHAAPISRAALTSARNALIGAGFVGPGPHGTGDPEINAIDAALHDDPIAPLPPEWVAFYEEYRPSTDELKELVRKFEADRAIVAEDQTSEAQS